MPRIAIRAETLLNYMEDSQCTAHKSIGGTRMFITGRLTRRTEKRPVRGEMRDVEIWCIGDNAAHVDFTVNAVKSIDHASIFLK